MYFLYIDNEYSGWMVEITKGGYYKIEEFYVVNGNWKGKIDYKDKVILAYDNYDNLKNSIPFKNEIIVKTDNPEE